MTMRCLLLASCLLLLVAVPLSAADGESGGFMGRFGKAWQSASSGKLVEGLDAATAGELVKDYVQKPAGELVERMGREWEEKSLDELLDEYVMRPARGAVEYYKGKPMERFVNDFFGENEDESGEPEQDEVKVTHKQGETKPRHVANEQEARAYVAEQTARCVPTLALQMDKMPRKLGRKLIKYAFALGHANCATSWGGQNGEPLYLRFDYTDDARIKAAFSGVISLESLSAKERQAYDVAKQVVRQVKREHSHDYDVAVALHDHLLLNCHYDTWKRKIKGATVRMLLQGRGVCNAYMRAYSVLLHMAGIENEYICGGNHGWNMVNLEGKWTHVDVTWDDPLPDVKGRVMHHWFGMTDAQMRPSHSWNRSLYPRKATSKSLYYPDRVGKD